MLCASCHSEPGSLFNIKMSSYQYRKSHCGDKTVVGFPLLVKWHLYVESGPWLQNLGKRKNVISHHIKWSVLYMRKKIWHFKIHKGQWCGALMFSLISAWINGWINNHKSGDLKRNHAHYDIIVMNELTPELKSVSCFDKTVFPCLVWDSHHKYKIVMTVFIFMILTPLLVK